MVGTGRAAELGILFRKGDALQSLRDASVVALDKTGTLTNGRPELTDLIMADGFAEAEVLRLVAAAEARSEHPIGGAIVAAAARRGVGIAERSEEHTSELQSLMRISYAVFCLKKKTTEITNINNA